MNQIVGVTWNEFLSRYEAGLLLNPFAVREVDDAGVAIYCLYAYGERSIVQVRSHRKAIRVWKSVDTLIRNIERDGVVKIKRLMVYGGIEDVMVDM